ncbi:mycofactocin-coupled SDR family oxidoreductase [Frankia sp. CNm7]|uniref:Mycofactocin-coupled SDR family oxidoreductase n=1 Tax=Frankia nepalensis TaxID=1836974 RepID=A0A937RJB4_9ACTN|nr:mycofactocin-coupled SDR family oxidoreductase [Frankia nepalensis]MBL7501093.1 mycofactocin-coupled SDR family oxidoreductase [Frankia nepalensis]MBL7512958.1 mycofactocin-coupled SDR family oxidoreductase [Frankia nepalensis]MBL7519874.1 mycofactocin-coupled SDR family oxidoreductase [Frankia nepalensis]MBL7631287.1 mycofactocin-coupled SDR family oxidoreductase [Frankia nepalensis]
MTPSNGRLRGKVAFITGAARGQGRSHAVALAREGADIAALDIADQIESVPYPMATRGDLEETVALVAAAGGRCVPIVADVRDIHAMDGAVKQTLGEFGRLDIVLANAGILHISRGAETLDQSARNWADAVGVMLTGVYNTIRVAAQPMIDQGDGGSIVITSSTAGLAGMHDGTGGIAGYSAAKHGVVGLMRGYAKVLGRHGIRVNTVHPMGVATPMVMNDRFAELYEDPEGARILDVSPRLLPINILEPADVTNAIVWLVSDEARAITGITLPVDAGVTSP